MKRFLFACLVLAGFALQSCDEEGPGDEYNISNPLPAYAEISSKAAKTAIEGTAVEITLRTREAFQEAITLNWEVTGAFTATGTATIPKGATSVSVPVTIPSGVVPADQNSALATFTLTGAKRGDVDLRIGISDPEKEKVMIKAIKNMVAFETDSISVMEMSGGQVLEIPVTFGSELLAETELAYTVTAVGGNTANSLEVLSANPLVIEEGATGDTIRIRVKDNLAVNPSNLYEVKLISLTSAVETGAEVYIGADMSTLKVNVEDDLRTVAFADAASPMELSAATTVNYEVRLDAPSTERVVVTYTISGGIAGVDYVDNTVGTITFNPGATVANLNVTLPTTAFAGDEEKRLTIKLGTVASTDDEVMLGEDDEVVLVLQ